MARRGISLAEVVLAIGLLVVCFLPLASLFSMTSAQTIKSRNYLLAQHLASNLFELYRVKTDAVLNALQPGKPMSAADVLTNKDVRGLLTGGAKAIEDTIDFSKFKMKVEIERTLDGKVGLDRIETTLEWVEEGGPRSRVYARIVSP